MGREDELDVWERLDKQAADPLLPRRMQVRVDFVHDDDRLPVAHVVGVRVGVRGARHVLEEGVDEPDDRQDAQRPLRRVLDEQRTGGAVGADPDLEARARVALDADELQRPVRELADDLVDEPEPGEIERPAVLEVVERESTQQPIDRRLIRQLAQEVLGAVRREVDCRGLGDRHPAAVHEARVRDREHGHLSDGRGKEHLAIALELLVLVVSYEVEPDPSTLVSRPEQQAGRLFVALEHADERAEQQALPYPLRPSRTLTESLSCQWVSCSKNSTPLRCSPAARTGSRRLRSKPRSRISSTRTLSR